MKHGRTEREIPGVGGPWGENLQGAAATSCSALTKLNGFPANKITGIQGVIDPTTAAA